MSITPPPSFFRIAQKQGRKFTVKQRVMRLAAALVAMLMSVPVMAQKIMIIALLIMIVTTGSVTATPIMTKGLVGSSACTGVSAISGYAVTPVVRGSTDGTSVSITVISFGFAYAKSVLFPDDSSITEITTRLEVRNSKTNELIGSGFNLGNLMSSSTDETAQFSNTQTGLTPKTPFYIVLYATATGNPSSLGLENPLARTCYMSGGTYTPTRIPYGDGGNGCFSISPLEPMHIRNCLCGRESFYTPGTHYNSPGPADAPDKDTRPKQDPSHNDQQTRFNLGCAS